MTDLRDALRRAGEAGRSARPDHDAIHAAAQRIVRRRRVMYASGAAVVAVVVGFGAVQIAAGNWFDRGPSGSGVAGDPTPTSSATPTSTPAPRLDPIVVETPTATEASEGVRSPVTIAGTADVYEGTVLIRIKDSNGAVVGETFTTATCGSGCRGDFSTEVDFDVATEQLYGTIEVYSESAETGEPMHLVEISARLLPPDPDEQDGDRAAIELDSHEPGDRMTSPTIVAGTANVYEANVRIRLLDENGDILVDTFTTATCGSGCRGDYSKNIRFDVDREQPGTLQVFEESAESGAMVNLVEIDVVLVPN